MTERDLDKILKEKMRSIQAGKRSKRKSKRIGIIEETTQVKIAFNSLHSVRNSKKQKKLNHQWYLSHVLYRIELI